MAIENLYKQLYRLSVLDFNGWNETDVREDFIKPLLNLLGYRKNTDYDINREGKHQLHKPFLMIGRKRVDIDYELLVRKKQFWIIEAKPAYPKEIQEKDIFQAHYYALHPEVNARYFAVINGWNILIYDSRNIDENYQPVLKISVNELPQKFLQLNNILGAKNIVPMLKQRVFDDIKDILSVEVMEERLQEFSLSVDTILESVRPVVRENRRNIRLRKKIESEQKLKQIYLNITLEELIKLDFVFPNNLEKFRFMYEVFNSKFEVLNNVEKSKAVTIILQVLRGRPLSCHRYNLISLLVKILPNNETLSDSLSFSSIADEIKRAIKDCLTHFKNQPWLRELWELEGNLYRVFYKLTFFSNQWYDVFFNKIVEIKKEILDDEELVFEAPYAPRERVDYIEELVTITYYQSISRDEQSISQLNRKLNEFESRLNLGFQEEIKEVNPEDKILLNYPGYNKPFDFLNSGLFHFLYEDSNVLESLMDDEILELIIELLQKDRGQYTANWIDVFLVKHLFHQNRYQTLIDFSINHEMVDLQILFKNLFNHGKIFTYVEPLPDKNKTVIKVLITKSYNPSGEWELEGELDIKDKIIKFTALDKKKKHINDPIKPIAFPTSDKDQSERND